MNCIYHRWRQKDYRKYHFCTLKKTIILDNCENCLNKQCRKNKPIKKRTNKQSKLERERDKNIVKSGICENCDKYSNRLDPHEVYGGSNRKRSIKNKFVKLLCRDCHENQDILNKIKKEMQIEYEKTHTREEFIKLIGKSYLD
jgi:hypothetical protein